MTDASRIAAGADGIHAPVPREKMPEHVRKLRDTYTITPGAPLRQEEFGFYCRDAWADQGLPRETPWGELAEMFGYDPGAKVGLGGLGWCEAAFYPRFDEKVIEDRGEHEVVQDFAGRHVLCFKGRRSGFMPEYVDHPVKDMKSWEENCKWRLDPATSQRYADIDEHTPQRIELAGQGYMVTQQLVGGYMYLRSLIGPEGIMYAFHDMPEVVHECIKTWLQLADAIVAYHQKALTIDEIFFAEDICYNHGLLCSPETMKEFILPYYQQLIANLKGRRIDHGRHLFVQIDTDGDCRPAIPVYREAIGMDVMSPFEAASGCDVVEIGRQHPWLVMRGGIDKRVLARGKAAIDEMVERILPAMRARGGYTPVCDHGVPAEVPLQDYKHYRRRCLELGG